MDFSSIQDIDFQILQWFNGSNNVILDQLVMALTSGFTWIPLYLVLFIIVMRNNETVGQIGLIVGCAFLCILFADGIAEGIIKPLAARWRPSNDPLVKYSVQVVDNLRLKDYSFCSAHAANTMAIAVFFSLLVRSRLLTFTLVAWSLVNCWTRLYLGVHYPLDIVCCWAWWLVRWYIFSSIVCTGVCHRKSSMFRINIPVRDMIAMTSI